MCVYIYIYIHTYSYHYDMLFIFAFVFLPMSFIVIFHMLPSDFEPGAEQAASSRGSKGVQRKGVWISVNMGTWTCKELRVKHDQHSCYLRPPFLGTPLVPSRARGARDIFYMCRYVYLFDIVILPMLLAMMFMCGAWALQAPASRGAALLPGRARARPRSGSRLRR